MDLNQADLEELAAFFGRRLDPRLARTPPPADAREEKRRSAAWLLVLEEAADQNRLSGLFARIRQKHPNDEQLQTALALLLEPGRRGDNLVGAVLLAAMAAGFLFITTAATGGGALLWYSLQLEETIAAHRALGQVMVTTVDTGDDLRASRREHAAPTGRCTVPDGGLVGYWYAGEARPGQRGELAHLSGAVNVRVDYPGAHNGYANGARIRCVLRAGDRVTLSAEPIQVPGRHQSSWWVPLMSGDLLL